MPAEAAEPYESVVAGCASAGGDQSDSDQMTAATAARQRVDGFMACSFGRPISPCS